MSHSRVNVRHALILSLAIVLGRPVVAQTQAAPPAAASEKVDAATKAAEAAKAEVRRKQVEAALDQGAELMRTGKLDEAIALLEATDK